MKVAIVFIALFAIAAANWFKAGVCPDNRGAGERWVDSSNNCTECYCDHTGWGCETCDIVTPIIGCYEVEDNSLPFPECCPRLKCPPLVPQTGK